jgi:phosphatidylglycerol---prolipoprotein diacylglyceryl transferase
MIGFINWNIDPEIVNLFGFFPLRYYSLLFVTGLILGYLIVKQIYIRENEPVEPLDKLAFFIFIGTIFGARLGHCLFYEPHYYLNNPLEILLPFTWDSNGKFVFTGYQGLASHGGAIGVLIAMIVYSRQEKRNLLWIMDRVAVATPVVGAFIRIGNFMNSEIIGVPTQSRFGVIFNRIDTLPRHPAQLYEAFAYLCIFGLLLCLKLHKKQRNDGFLFGLLLVLLFGARFIIEFFKIDQVDFEQGMNLNMGQILSLPFIFIGLLILTFRMKKKKYVGNNTKY